MAKRVVRLQVKELRVDCIDESPTSMDWTKIFGETQLGEETNVYEASTCNGCEKMLVTPSMGEFSHEQCATFMGLDDADRGEGELCRGEVRTEGPMMNSFWPLPDNIFSRLSGMSYKPSDAALRIGHLPLCIIETDGFGVGFGLTGGGMDMSWYIAEGYLRLGFYPPRVIRLPRMAGYPRTPRQRWIVKGCIKSQKITKRWSDNNLEELRRLLKEKKDD